MFPKDISGLMNLSEIINNVPGLQEISRAADELDFDTYVVGGFVRDHLLKRKRKEFDIDIVAVGSGIQLAKKVAERLGKKKDVTVYRNFGTAMFSHENIQFEFVGARKESYRSDSRKPIVEDGSLQDDQNRRDFTINALAISLNQSDLGELIDPFGGLDDLNKKIIKTPLDPDLTFSDDPLRMLRAIRFASQLDFDIEPDTFEAIINNKHRIEIVSQERITGELEKIIMTRKLSYGFKLLFHSGLLGLVFPEVADLQGVEQIKGKGHKDNFYHTLQVLDNVAKKTDDLWLRWAALLHDVAKPVTQRFDEKTGWTFHGHEEIGARMVPRIFRKMKLPMGEPMRFVQKMVRLHLRPIALVSEEITDSAARRLLFEAGDDIDKLMLLCKADITSKNPEKVKRYLNNFARVEKKLEMVEEKDKVRNFQPPISGDEIMDIFDLKPSREVGIIKNEIKEAILDGKIRNNYNEAYDYMMSVASRLGIRTGSKEKN